MKVIIGKRNSFRELKKSDTKAPDQKILWLSDGMMKIK
jgi:hypothetical protein